jgi:hypothetical protein
MHMPSEGYFVERPRTNGLIAFFRDLCAGRRHCWGRSEREGPGLYPLYAQTESGEPPAPVFVNISGLKFNTISKGAEP